MAIDLDTNTLNLLGVTSPNYIEGTSRGETISGGGSNDYIKGLGGLDILNGGNGNDYIESGAGVGLIAGISVGDTVNGGDGNDTAGYFQSAVAVTVNLLLGAGFGGDATLDVLLNVENVVGSNLGGDTLIGNTADNKLFGMGGNDTLYGGDGVDTIHGDAGDDKIYGEAGNDTFYFSSQNNAMDGGTGTDTVDYSGVINDIGTVVDLRPGAGGLGHGGDAATGDTYNFIENVVGSRFNDRIYGTDGPSNIFGGAGSDNLLGGGGNDVINGGDGDDQLRGGGGADTLNGGAGSDRFFYETVADLDGDRINGLNVDTDHEKIDLRAIGVTDLRFVGTSGDVTQYRVTAGTANGYIYVQFDGSGTHHDSLFLI